MRRVLKILLIIGFFLVSTRLHHEEDYTSADGKDTHSQQDI
jgi:hypothetical protein